MGTQMEALVLGWFILTLTDSPFLVGAISAARMALNIMALFAGVIADRVPRHKILAAVEFLMAAFAGVMLVLILTGLLETWHVFAIAVVAGMVRVFQMPAAQAMVADTLPEERIANGAALNNLGRNIAMLLGPLAGGILFNSYGPKGAFTAIAVLYLVSGWVALYIRSSSVPVQDGKKPEPGSVIRDVIAGLKYVKGEQVLWGTLVLALAFESTGWTFHTTLMPIFARDVLDSDSAGLGLLLFAFGIGAITGSAILTAFRNLRYTGKFLIGAVVMWHVSILAFAASQSFYLSMSVLFAMGIFFSATQVFMLTVLLRTTKPEFRGRIIGLRVLAIYAFSFGSVGAGTMAELWGAPWAANIVGITGIVLVLALVAFTPKLRQV